jgi:uncharacterized protein (TIGR03435 family)
MAELASHLRQHVYVGRQVFDREVIDRTGLGGRFDFSIQWTPDAEVPRSAVQFGMPQYRPFVSSLEVECAEISFGATGTALSQA